MSELETITASPLGLIHRMIGPLQQLLRLAAMLGIHSTADAGQYKVRQALQLKGLTEGEADLFGDAGNAFCCTGIFQQYDKLIARQARRRIGLTDAAQQTLSDHLQQLVAGLVTETVVDLLELVQIEEQQRQLRLLAFGARQGNVQAVEQQGPVGQAGELIELRHELQAAEHALPLDKGG